MNSTRPQAKASVRARAGRVLAVLGALAALVAPVEAALVEWVGGNNDRWEVAASWSGAVVPGSSDEVVIATPGTVRAHGTAMRAGSLASDADLRLGGDLQVSRAVNERTIEVEAQGSMRAAALSTLAASHTRIDGNAAVGLLSNAGTIVLGTSGRLDVGLLMTSGALTVESGGTLTVSNLLQNGGQVRLGDSTVTGSVTVVGGVFSGPGRVAGNLTVSPAGTLDVGAAGPGTSRVEGDARLGGRTVFDIFDSTTFDHISAGGNLHLDGTLEVRFDAGYEAAAGQQFALFGATTFSGTPSVVLLPEIDGLTLRLADVAGVPTLLVEGGFAAVSAVPLPASLWMLTNAGICLLVIRRRPPDASSAGAEQLAHAL